MNHQFQNPAFIEEALTHTSWAYENGGQHNERLEFLGDAVLQLTCTDLLYARFQEAREGVLHSYRVQLVSTVHLAKLARAWGLGDKVKLGKGEDATGGRQKERLLAGLFEAVLGAIYLDGGFEAAQAEVRHALEADIEALSVGADPRVTLHEWCQRVHRCPPVYVVIDQDGLPHERVFSVEVSHPDGVMGQGSGRSKKAASIAAARAAVDGGFID
jgi:ribonuclease-3